LEKFWADGKRFLDKAEEATLNEEDKDIYQGWFVRKNKKTDKSRERDYAVKTAKRERATKLVTEAAILALSKKGELTTEAAQATVKAEWEKAVAEDLTETLKNKPLKKKELETISKAVLKKAKAEKAEL